jgi:hypothetical protein
VTARERRRAGTRESHNLRRREYVYIVSSPPLNMLTGCSCEQRRNAAMEYYDTSDPFIDDSELPMDERTFFAQTKQQGFYVSSGEVALLKDKYEITHQFAKRAGTDTDPHFLGQRRNLRVRRSIC